MWLLCSVTTTNEHWIWLMCSHLKCVYVNFPASSWHRCHITFDHIHKKVFYVHFFPSFLIFAIFLVLICSWQQQQHHQLRWQWSWSSNVFIICLEFTVKSISRIIKRKQEMTMHPRLVLASTTTIERYVETTKNNKKNYGDVRTNKSISQVSMSISFLFPTNKIDWKYQCKFEEHLVCFRCERREVS